MKPLGSLPHSQEPATGPYSKPVTSPCSQWTSLCGLVGRMNVMHILRSYTVISVSYINVILPHMTLRSPPELFFHCDIKCETVHAFLTPPHSVLRHHGMAHPQVACGGDCSVTAIMSSAQSRIVYKRWSSSLAVGHEPSNPHHEASVSICTKISFISAL
jgi:hypothetical protein